MAFRMYLTETDHSVLHFIEEFGSITITQCKNIFYNTQKYGYDIARKRLGKLVQYKKLEVTRDSITSQNVYYMDKKLRKHDILVMDFYSYLVYSGANIIYFNAEQQWMKDLQHPNGKYRSDAYVSYILNDKLYFNVLEVVRTSGVDENKYADIFKSGEAQYLNNEVYRQVIEQFKVSNPSQVITTEDNPNDFPRLIILDNVNHKKQLDISSYIKTFQMDLNFNNFSKIFV